MRVRTHRTQDLRGWSNEGLRLKHDTEIGISETDKMLFNE